jgi:two-component system, NtrC family, sensor kinase
VDRQGKRVASSAAATTAARKRTSAATELADARAQQAAVNEILRVMADSPADVMVVLNAIAEQAARLCHAPFAHMTVIEDGVLRPIAGYAVDGKPAAAAGSVPLARSSIQGRAILERRTLHFDDIEPILEDEFPAAIQNARTMGFRAVLAVPLLRGNDALGAIFLYRREPGLFTPDQVALVETFARQAAIALQSVRQFRATQDGLEQQTATSEILRVISQAREDVQPVFDTIARSALTLCGAESTIVATVEDELIHMAASANISEESALRMRRRYPRPVGRGTATGRAILTRRVAIIPDTHVDPDYDTDNATDQFRSAVAVPLLRDGEPIGAIGVGRSRPGRFTDGQMTLLQTFADQAVIAIENVRLFTELGRRNAALSESLEQRTATSDILAVISQSPTDVQPVFETIAENALRLCEGVFSGVFRFDGELIHIGALRNISPEGDSAFRRTYPCKPNRNGTTQRAVLTGQMVHMPDIRLESEYGYHDIAETAGFRSVLSIPMLHDGAPIGAIAVYREVAGPFPEEKISLLRTFADQAVIAVQNVRLFKELQQRNGDLTHSLEQQTATSDILRVISQSQTDVQPVFDTIARSVLSLCRAEFANVFTYDGKLIHLAAYVNKQFPEYIETVRSYYPQPPSRNTAVTRAIATGDVAVIPDVLTDPDYQFPAASAGGGFRSILAVPLMRDGKPVGGIAVGRPEPGQFPESQVALLKTFADQAVIAIENVRLFTELQERNRDLSEALEHQTATSEILRVIARTPGDVQPVFDTIAASALKLCRAASALVTRAEGDMVEMVASANLTEAGAAAMREAFPMPLGRQSTSARAIVEARIVVIPDVMTDPEYGVQAHALRAAFRSTMAVPLMRDGRPIGTITVGKPQPGPFSGSLVTLLQTFAEQAVIAIENVRLFNELDARNRDLTEALEQQTATSDILRVISKSQTDVQPVFDTIVRSVRTLCNATFSGVYLLDGDTIGLAATSGMTDAMATVFSKGYPRRIGADTVSGRAALECRVVQTNDLMTDPDYAGAPGTFVGARTVLGVPLVRDGRAIGSIGVWRNEVKPFSETQISLLQTFADQAVIAIENVRLFNELNARTEQLTRSVGELRALGEVGQAVSSTLDVETVLGTIVARVTKLTGMDGGSIYEYDEEREEFHLHSANGIPADVVEALRASPIRKGEGALGMLATTGEAVEIRDVADERVYQSRVRDALVRIGYRSMLVVPLLRENHLLGGLIVNRKAPGAFDLRVLELMKTFATQSAMAIQNARLYREIEIKSRELETASRHKSEFLANMSHELRTPLNAIIGFSEVLGERLFGDLNTKQAEYVTDIAESGRHLLELINDILDLSKIEAGRMELDAGDVDLPKTIAQTLSLVRERAERRGIALSSAVDDAIGIVRADARKVKQVLLNLLSNALKFTPEGGRIDVRATAFADRVEVSVTDTGIGIAPEDQAAVFEEFRQVGASAARVEGTGLGLAISRKFIELHGGRMWLTSAPGKGSTFTFSLPLQRS